MVLPLIQMETTSPLPGKNSIASQGGLTPPKLYQLGPDFQNRSRKTRKRRQVRISCIFVAHYFCARVKSQIVAIKYSNINIYKYKHINIYKYSHINIYKYKHISMCLYKRSLMYPHRWKMTVTPLQWKMRVTLPVEIILLTPPRELCKVILVYPRSGNKEKTNGKYLSRA